MSYAAFSATDSWVIAGDGTLLASIALPVVVAAGALSSHRQRILEPTPAEL